MARPLILREGEPSRSVELPRSVADALAASGVVQVGWTDRPGWWEVAASNQIGVVVAGGVQVVIQPKLDINRLVFLMGYARHPDFWRDDHVRLDTAADLPEALTDAFVRLAKRALEQGLLKGYQTLEETLPVLRGRIREADQLRRRWGKGIPLEVRYDEYTVDIAENRLLLAATEQLLRTPQVSARHRVGLQRLRLLLADVTTPVRGSVRPLWTPSRLNARYAPALELAELVLDGRSFEQCVGDVVVSGYLFNMATIFEDFVTVALREALKPYGGRSLLQYATHLDEDAAVPVRPDFVWLEQGRPRIVVDAKYKAEKPSGFPQADLYQMLAYCTVLGLPEGHLVYAKGNEDAHEHVVRRAGVRIVTHALDLDVQPAELLATMATMVNALIRAATQETAPSGELIS
ncbi:MAG: restriction endonuclease [Acidobacteriota bacterium]|nr:restriction endonuclease [Acidobacteriota bacterium]